MWPLAAILAVGILTVIAYQHRQELDNMLRDELDAFLEEVLA